MKRSEETKMKISLKNSKPILVFKDGNFINEFMSITEAANKLCVHRQNIQKVLKETIYTTGGYKFVYKNNK